MYNDVLHYTSLHLCVCVCVQVCVCVCLCVCAQRGNELKENLTIAEGRLAV